MALVTTPGPGPNGALVESPEPALTIGIVVSELDRALESAVASGGSVTMPATDNGWVVKAQIRDPAGNRLTLIARAMLREREYIDTKVAAVSERLSGLRFTRRATLASARCNRHSST